MIILWRRKIEFSQIIIHLSPKGGCTSSLGISPGRMYISPSREYVHPPSAAGGCTSSLKAWGGLLQIQWWISTLLLLLFAIVDNNWLNKPIWSKYNTGFSLVCSKPWQANNYTYGGLGAEPPAKKYTMCVRWTNEFERFEYSEQTPMKK